MIETDVDGVLRAVDDALAAGLPDDVAPIAGFDADHTLWNADVGDTAFLGAEDAGMIDAATWDGPFSAWCRTAGVVRSAERRQTLRAVVDAIATGEIVARAAARGVDRDAALADAYAMQAWIYAPAHGDSVEGYGERLFAGGFAAHVFAGARRLLDALRARGLRTVVITASHRRLVVPGAGALGFPPADVFGMEPDVDDGGRTQPRVTAPLYGPQKAVVLSSLTGKRPFLAFGDSVLATDRAMLQAAHVPIAVEPKGAHADAASAWTKGRILRF